MARYVIGIDAGTTGSRTVIYDLKGNEVGGAYVANPLQFPKPGIVLCDPQAIVDGCQQSTRDAIRKTGIDPREVGSVSFTMMRSSWVMRAKDGSFPHDIIMWQDMRGVEMFDWMRERIAAAGMSEMDHYNKCAFPISAILPSSKMIWFKKHHRDIWDKVDKIHTIHALVAEAYGADGYCDNDEDSGWYQITDADKFEFDPELCKMWDLEIDKFVKTAPAGTRIGEVTSATAQKTGLAVGTPLIMGSGDHQCGAVGVGLTKPGIGYVCLGTAGLIVARSEGPIRHPSGKTHVVGAPTCDGTKAWEIEGHASAAASSFRWVRDCIGDMECAAAKLTCEDVYDVMTKVAKQAPVGSDGMVYLPWLAGANCPHYDANARGSFIGMTFSHRKPHMVRSAMEGVCFEMREMIYSLLEADVKPFEVIRVAGGAARSDLWNQIAADIYKFPIETVSTGEPTALGAAMIGAVGAGVFSSLDEAIANMVRVTNHIEPIKQNVETYDRIFDIFEKSYHALAKEAFPAIAKYQGF